MSMLPLVRIKFISVVVEVASPLGYITECISIIRFMRAVIYKLGNPQRVDKPVINY